MNIIEKIYGNKIRIRICGIFSYKGKVLLVNHCGLNNENIFWNFPGGGLELNETIEITLKREFIEETGIEVSVDKFVFFNELISKPLHALEYYFKVKSENNEFILGKDPEHNIISDIKWFNYQDLLNLPLEHKPNFINNEFESILNKCL